MAGQDVFKGALGLDDWAWWIICGGVGLLILLLLVCCCVCVQRAKRKGHEEALASVQRRQREAEQRHAQQQQQAQQASTVAPFDGYGGGGGGSGGNYAKPVQAVPLAQPPHRKPMGPQVAANGYLQPQPPPYALPPFQHREQAQQPHQQPYAQPQQPPPHGHYPPSGAPQQYAQQPQQPRRHQEQYQKPYPALPQQQQQQQQQPAVQFHEPDRSIESPPKPMKRRYHPPPRWYNALAGDGAAASSPSTFSNHNAFTDEAHGTPNSAVDSIRYDPYGTQGNLDGSPFVAVTSPTAGSGHKKRAQPPPPALAKTAPSVGLPAKQLPPPVVVASQYQSAPPPAAGSIESRYAGPRAGTGFEPNTHAVNATYSTLADRIDALRESKADAIAHSRVSDLRDRDMPSPASAVSSSAFASFSTSSTPAERRGEDPARRSGLTAGSVLSPSSSSTRSAGTSTSTSGSARRRSGRENLVDDSFDGALLSLGAQSASTAADASTRSDYSHGQFEDADDVHSRGRQDADRQPVKPVDRRESVEF